MPATFDDVERYALELPDVTVGARWDHKTWFVGKKGFAWERPLNKADVKRWGDAIPLPQGEIVAVRVEDLEEKEAVLQANPDAFFTIQHFDNYPAVLVELRKVHKRALKDALVNGWLACAPAKLARAYVEAHAALKR